jgi:hypothetical protein
MTMHRVRAAWLSAPADRDGSCGDPAFPRAVRFVVPAVRGDSLVHPLQGPAGSAIRAARDVDPPGVARIDPLLTGARG